MSVVYIIYIMRAVPGAPITHMKPGVRPPPSTVAMVALDPHRGYYQNGRWA